MRPRSLPKGSRVLEVEYYAPDAVAVDALDVVRRQDEPDLIIEGVDHRPRLRDGGERSLEGGFRGLRPGVGPARHVDARCLPQAHILPARLRGGLHLARRQRLHELAYLAPSLALRNMLAEGLAHHVVEQQARRRAWLLAVHHEDFLVELQRFAGRHHRVPPRTGHLLAPFAGWQ